MPLDCSEKCGRRAAMKRPKTGDTLCQECFFRVFEEEVHKTIVDNALFRKGDYVAVAASGGKDSTVLAYIMKLLNERHDYGLRLVLLSVDEGITGYRDDSLETVKRNEKQYNIPLQIYSYKDLYGWTMDEIVREVGRKNNCTFCGVFRRQALDRGAMLLEVNKIVTGHNADDVAETILMNLLRGDVARLQRCTNITTGAEGTLPRCKPFKYTYEKEIVMYAYYKKLDYFSTECIYSPNAYRGHVRALIKDLERIKPSSIVDIIHSGEALSIREGIKMPTQGICKRCKYISSQDLCKACVMLDGLNKGLPKLGIGKSSKVKGQLERINGGCVSACDTKGGATQSKSGCCGGGGSCNRSEDNLTISTTDEIEVNLTSESRKGRRSTNKLKKAQDRKNNLKPKTDLTHSSVGTYNDDDKSFDATEDDLNLEFFGCGGSADPFDTDADEVGTLVSKMSTSMPVNDVDIENLAELASAMLGRKNNKS